MSTSSVGANAFDFFTSSTEIDARLRRSVDYLLRIKDKDTRIAYEHYNIHSQTLSSLLALNIMLFIFSMAFFFIIGMNFRYTKTTYDVSNSIATLVFLGIVNIMSWKAYLQQQAVMRSNAGQLPNESRLFLQVFQKKLYFMIQFVLAYRNVIKVIAGSCPEDADFGGDFACNPMHSAQSVPVETSVLIMLVPLIYCISVRGAHFEYSLFLWAMAIGVLAFCIVYAHADNSVVFVLYYAIGGFVILSEARKVNYFLFFTHLKLQEILDERQKAADEANATEMRHMIANVAHDLKTPLASFLGGIEYISQVMAEIASKRQQARHLISAADMEDFIQSVSTCVTNMRNTNSFMLMTINRCIDYTKASKGVKLVPKPETIDLLESLALPFNCMQDVQQRVSIDLEPLAKDICSHIITDKQWLQENVLCLLSNAVKYSNDGQVTMRVTKVQPPLSVRVTASAKATTPKNSDSHSSFRFIQSYRNHDHAKVYCEAAGSKGEGSTSSSNHVNLLFLRVEVEDSGIGLSEEAMATLFSPFKQAQRLAGGTGLGLFSMAKRIEALEGRCGVERRRDGKEGSLFWFEIPYRADNQASRLLPHAQFTLPRRTSCSSTTQTVARSSQNSSFGHPTHLHIEASALVTSDLLSPSEKYQNAGHSASSTGLGTPKAQMDILVVDDSPAILKMTTMMLKRHKHSVTTATNGAEAVKLVNEHISSKGKGFDVVLMDLQMPVMDGLEATRRLRGFEKSGVALLKADLTEATELEDVEEMCYFRNIIIGVSANSDNCTATEAYSVGMDSFLPKPFSLDSFYSTYDLVVSQRK